MTKDIADIHFHANMFQEIQVTDFYIT